MRGRINEIFSSIQGEGVYAGQRQIFVRFSGCNLRCSYCDTEFDTSQEYSARELLSEIASFGKGFHSISFTGGEPLLQKDFLKEILALVKQAGERTYLETNGTLPLALREVIENVDIIAMDIKLPSSGGHNDFWQEHRESLSICAGKDVFIKAVIGISANQEDFMKMLGLLKSMCYRGALVLQPNSFEMDKLDEKLAIFKKYAQGHPFVVYVIPQMHKLIGVK
jgi:organic radical activating enzyme